MPSPEQASRDKTSSHGVQQVQNFYFNSFNLGISNADMNALLMLDGQPVCRLSMSFTTAKTMQTLLNELVKSFEEATGHDVMLTEEVENGLRKLAEEHVRK